jgi:NAD(P)-dependent dehydrogenase (short-subunit alcohol dehydrogenase family)
VPSPATPFRLDGKLALVTGAGRGIGRAVALALADAGAELLLNSRTPAELDALAADIAAQGGWARALPFERPALVRPERQRDRRANPDGSLAAAAFRTIRGSSRYSR